MVGRAADTIPPFPNDRDAAGVALLPQPLENSLRRVAPCFLGAFLSASRISWINATNGPRTGFSRGFLLRYGIIGKSGCFTVWITGAKEQRHPGTRRQLSEFPVQPQMRIFLISDELLLKAFLTMACKRAPYVPGLECSIHASTNNACYVATEVARLLGSMGGAMRRVTTHRMSHPTREGDVVLGGRQCEALNTQFDGRLA